MNRRQFNKNILSLGALNVLAPFSASFFSLQTNADILGVKYPSKYFLMVYAGSGWDTTLSTDPWILPNRLPEQEIFVEYRHDELLPFNNGRLVGPAMKPFEKYFKNMAIINGVFMSALDGGHASAEAYIESGNGQGSLAGLPAELEGKLFNSPFGTAANSSSMSTGGKAKRIWDISSGGVIDVNTDFIDFGENTELAASRRALANNQPQIEIFNKVLNESVGPNRTFKENVAAAFYSGLSSTSFIALGAENLDSHSNHPGTHLTNLTKNFKSIQDLLDLLGKVEAPNEKGVSLLDKTTVMIVSEFTRTPALNASKGKDHNPQSNSVILMGPGINPGVYGGSRVVERSESSIGIPYLCSVPLDKKTQTPVLRKDDTFILRPEVVIASVTQSMGLDPKSISVGLGKSPVLNSLLKS